MFYLLKNSFFLNGCGDDSSGSGSASGSVFRREQGDECIKAEQCKSGVCGPSYDVCFESGKANMVCLPEDARMFDGEEGDKCCVDSQCNDTKGFKCINKKCSKSTA